MTSQRRQFLAGAMAGLALAAVAAFSFVTHSRLPVGKAVLCVGVCVASATFAALAIANERASLKLLGIGAAAVVALYCGMFFVNAGVAQAGFGVVLLVASAAAPHRRAWSSRIYGMEATPDLDGAG